MKTDLVLTMDEYLDQCCIATKRVSPPAPDARHISIRAGDNLDLNAGEHGCRCDRWGHPCPNCVTPRRAKEQEVTSLAENK
jgi:hypothetical protein